MLSDSIEVDCELPSFSVQVSLFAELFNEMLQRDFGYRIYKVLAAFPNKDDKKEKEKKVKKEMEKREIKKEKEDETEGPVVKKIKEDEDEKKKASLFQASQTCFSICFFLTFTSFV